MMWGSDSKQTYDRSYSELVVAVHTAAAKLTFEGRAALLAGAAMRLRVVWVELRCCAMR
jgi:hypothetical protein